MGPARMAKMEAAVRMSIDFIDGFNRHDAQGMVNLLSEDCSIESSVPAPDGNKYSGKIKIAGYLDDLFEKTSALIIHVEDMVGFGSRCIVRVKYNRKSNEGEDQYLRGAMIIQLKDGLIWKIFSYIKG